MSDSTADMAPEEQEEYEAYLASEQTFLDIGDEELIKSSSRIRMRRPRLEIPAMSISSRLSQTSGETTSPKGNKPSSPVKFSSVKLEAKPHPRYSEKPNTPYTKKQQKVDLKRAIKEEIAQKMETAGENNTNPRIPYPLALKGKKTTTITTDNGTYSTPEKNIIVGIHGKRFDVAISNPKIVFKH